MKKAIGRGSKEDHKPIHDSTALYQILTLFDFTNESNLIFNKHSYVSQSGICCDLEVGILFFTERSFKLGKPLGVRRRVAPHTQY